MNIKKDILWRVVLSIVFLALFGIGLMYSIVRLQVVEGDKWRQMSDSLYRKYKAVPAIRGSIYSEDGNLLATSVPIYRISLDFEVIRTYHKDSFQQLRLTLAEAVSRTLKNGSASHYDSILRRGYLERDRYLTLISSASYIQAQNVMRLPIFRAGRYKGGVIMEERTVRRKPYGGLMARTIGFINENKVGAGIEASYHDDLAGVDGKILVRKISGGYRPLDDELQINPVNGKDIFTTIDVHLQDIVNESLVEGVEENGAAFGTAILMEVKTGKIKAMANVDKTGTGYVERFNHAIGTAYETGSTMKLLSVMATLEEGEYSPDDSIDINHGRLIFSRRDTFEDSGDGHPRFLTYRQVFEQSSNVGIIRTTYNTFRSKPEKFLSYFDNLHLTKPLSTGIRGEVKPSIVRPTNPVWSASTLPSLSIGYSFTTSPLHMAMLYNAIANGGVMMKPYIISSIGYLGKAEKIFGSEVLNKKICSTSTLEILREFLNGVVENGTASSLKDLPFKVAGKTGTSKISGGSQGYLQSQYYSSFVGYFPSDQPRYTLLVLVAKPSLGKYYAASVAVPVFEAVARKVQANTLQQKIERIQPPHKPVLVTGRWTDVKRFARRFNFSYTHESGASSQLVRMVPGEKKLTVSATSNQEGRMPDLIGFGLRHALYELENKGYRVRFTGYGKVVEQAPGPGAVLTGNQVIYLKLGV